MKHKFSAAAFYRLILALLFATIFAGCGNESAEKPQSQTDATQVALCSAHQLPASDCFMCDPALRDPERLWCKEHNRYEDRCFICHPEIKEAGRLWCREHNLYEDECFFCHPELKTKTGTGTPEQSATGQTGDANTLTGNELFCGEHNLIENECGICHPDLAGELRVGQGLKIRFESAESATKAGVRFTKPVEGSAFAGMTFLGQVKFNQNRYARITPLASGVVQRVLSDVGDTVKKGDVLVELASPEIAAAKSRYLTALANLSLKEAAFNRKKDLINEKIAAQQDFEQATSEYEIAKMTAETERQQLLNFGFSENLVLQIAQSGSAPSMLQVIAPFSGTIVERSAVVGELSQPGDMLFALAELSTMWLDLSIPEDRIANIAPGDPVEATFEALPGEIFAGNITWLAAGLDENTRMLKARAVIPNPDARLKNGFYGQVQITPQRAFSSLMVPEESLHHFEKKPFVFARVADDLFEVRRVEIAGKNGGSVEIIAGLSPEDQIVSARSFTVKSEFLKARLGAGCVDE